MLLGETKGLRTAWASLVGKLHPMSIDLNVDVSDVNRSKPEYQVRGTVDVPGPAYSDDERDYLAKLLVSATDIPDKEKRGFRLHSWVTTDGGNGVQVRRCAPIPHLTEKDIIGEVAFFNAPDVAEIPNHDLISEERHNEWVREYERNPYCRLESRRELNQRWQDIQVNTQVLKPSGKMGLTSEEFWYRLGQHVIVEMLLRGEPPNEKNLDPRVRVVQPFFDGDLCRKAAAVSARGTANDVLVKYGKYKHMKDLFERGIVYMNVASDYDQSVHNPAIRDDERTIAFKGGYSSAEHPGQYYARHTVPKNVRELADTDLANFSTIYECPCLEQDEYAEVQIRMATNYWMFCMANVLDQRLFADFQADSCVIIRRRPFINRLLWAARLQFPHTNRQFASVDYVDPLGAFPPGNRLPIKSSMPIHLTKLFRYAYQREVRFVCLPRNPHEDLKPRQLEIGSISDIAQFIVL